MAITRRGMLAGGALAGLGAAGAYALVERGILPGQTPLNQALGNCDVLPPAASADPGTTVRGVFDSARRRRAVNYLIVYPPGTRPGDPLRVCLALHGFGGAAWDAINGGRYDRNLSSAVATGTPSFALAAMDGGPGYWHPHATDDPLGALLDEFPPVLASQGLVIERLAVLGWSMGGYGALLAGITRPDRFVAVVASSPAIWRSYAEGHKVNPGAFDSAAEWSRYDLIRRAAEFRGLPVRVDCGVSDSFAPGVRAFRERLPDPSVVHLAKGCHDSQFWQHAAPAQLRFIGTALQSAKRT